MKGIILTTVIALLSIVAMAQDKKVAVFDPAGNADKYVKEIVREVISEVVVNTNGYTVLERQLIDKVLEENRFQVSGLVDDAQISEMGRMIGANLVFVTSVITMGNNFFISGKMIDVQSARIEMQRTNETRNGANDLTVVVRRIVSEMLEQPARPEPAVISQPAVMPAVISQPAVTPAVTTQTVPITVTVVTAGTTDAEPEMVFVQGGTFAMGCTNEQGEDCRGREKPAHQVTLSSYYIGKYEVTQAQWEAIMDNNPSYFKGYDLPVANVTWNEIQEYISRLVQATGKQYRLPTEAEWEYAARGGNKSMGYKYSGGDNIHAVAWFSDNSGRRPYHVGVKLPNELGIHDMSGNVDEVCSDWYGKYKSYEYYRTNPSGPARGGYRVIRGGNYYNTARYLRVSYRYNAWSGSIGEIKTGFRLAISSE